MQQPIRVKLDVKHSGEWHHLTPLSDLHLDSESCDLTALRKLIKSRNELPNHRFICLGDVADWIIPSDQKRYRPSNLGARSGRDDITNEIINQVASELCECENLDLIVQGNHELTLLQRSNLDVIELVRRQINQKPIPYHGGHCGFLRYDESTKGQLRREGITILYHHGTWHGRQDIPPGALNFAAGFAGYDLFLFGHNHRLSTSARGVLYPEISHSSCRVVSKEYKIVTCGSFARGYVDAKMPAYEERKAMAPTTIGAPLIRWRRVHSSQSAKAGSTEIRNRLDCEVTI